METLLLNPLPPPTAVALVALLLTVLVYHRERLLIIIKCHRARRAVRKLAAEKDADAGGTDDDRPQVSGIFIHPGE